MDESLVKRFKIDNSMLRNQMAEATKSDECNINKNQHKNRDNSHYIRKRPVKKPEIKESIIYVSTKSSIKALLERCSKVINNNENEIIIYCLGAAIQRGILLALQICEKYPSFKTDTNTLTTELTDDLEPADDEDYEIQRRFNSALRIKVFRSNLLDESNIA